METNDTDKMLSAFFKENKIEIPDNGFSRKVMSNIPIEKDRSWIVWFFGAIGMAITMYFVLTQGLFVQVFMLFEKMPFYYIIAAIAVFPLLGTAGYYIFHDKRFSFI
ncbi:MAG: DUF5056 domain-containing protein [Paludibacter sp.]|nr:DUF5056 domain-containing protein [Paludibacter sp.]